MSTEQILGALYFYRSDRIFLSTPGWPNQRKEMEYYVFWLHFGDIRIAGYSRVWACTFHLKLNWRTTDPWPLNWWFVMAARFPESHCGDVWTDTWHFKSSQFYWTFLNIILQSFCWNSAKSCYKNCWVSQARSPNCWWYKALVSYHLFSIELQNSFEVHGRVLYILFWLIYRFLIILEESSKSLCHSETSKIKRILWIYRNYYYHYFLLIN